MKLLRKLYFILIFAMFVLSFFFTLPSPENTSKNNENSPPKLDTFLSTEESDTGCYKQYRLPVFSKKESLENNQLFFVESYFKPIFKGRQLCAIESAIRNSGYKVKVVLISPTLNLSSQVICNLVRNKGGHYRAVLGLSF